MQTSTKQTARLGQIIDLDEWRKRKSQGNCPNVPDPNIPDRRASRQVPQPTAGGWFRLGDLLPEFVERAERARARNREDQA